MPDVSEKRCLRRRRSVAANRAQGGRVKSARAHAAVAARKRPEKRGRRKPPAARFGEKDGNF